MALASAMYGDPSNPNQPMARRVKPAAQQLIDANESGSAPAAPSPIEPVLGMARRAIAEAPAAASATPAFFHKAGLNGPESEQAAFQVGTVNPLQAKAYQAQDSLRRVVAAEPAFSLGPSDAVKIARGASDDANALVRGVADHSAQLAANTSQAAADTHTNKVLADAGTGLTAPAPVAATPAPPVAPVAPAPVVQAGVARRSGAGGSGSTEAAPVDPNAIPAGVPGSVASSINAQGNKVYDNNSIARVMGQAGNGNPTGGDIGDQVGLPPAPVVQPQTIAAQPVNIRRSLNGDLSGSDSERQQRLSDVDSAISDLTMRNGGVNMRSKRELLGQLLGQKEAISKQGFDRATGFESQGAQEANAAAQSQARIAAEAGTHNADLGAAASEFNVGTGERRSELARSLLIGGRQYQLDLAKQRFDQGLRRNQELRDEDTFATGHQAAEQKNAADWKANYLTAHPGTAPEQVDALYATQQELGNGAVNPSAQLDEHNIAAQAVNATGNDQAGVIHDWAAGNGRAPFTMRRPAIGASGSATLDNNVNFTPEGGVSGVYHRAIGAPQVQMTTGDPNDPRSPHTFVPAAQAETMAGLRKARADRQAREKALAGDGN